MIVLPDANRWRNGLAVVILVGTILVAGPAVAQSPAGATSYIDRHERYPCQGALVAGSIFAPDSGKTAFEVRGVLVDSTGKAIVREVVTLWPLTGRGEGLFFGSPNKTNPESTTDLAGRFALSTGAINSDFNVVVGFDIHEQGQVCSIIPVNRDGKPFRIRLTGVPSVVDLGRVVVK